MRNIIKEINETIKKLNELESVANEVFKQKITHDFNNKSLIEISLEALEQLINNYNNCSSKKGG